MFKKPIHFIKKARKEALAGFFMMLASLTCSAQGAGAGAFTAAAGEISTYQEPVKNLIYVIAAVIILVGCFNIYHKMVNGDQDVKKTIMLTIGGCIALVVLANALPLFFK